MRSNILASGLAVVLGMGSPIVGAMSPDVVMAQSTVNLQSQSEQLLAKGKQQYRQADFRSAIATYQQALAIGQRTNDRATQIDALLQLGDIDFWMGQVPAAEPKFQQALKLARESGDSGSGSQSQRLREGEVLAAVAAVARDKGDYPQAMTLLKQSLAIAQETKNAHGEARAQFFMGSVLCRQEQYPQALETLNQALKLAQALPDQEEAALIQSWLTVTHIGLKDFKQAEVSIQTQQALSRSIGHRLSEYGGLSVVVFLGQQQKQPDRVLQAYQKQLTIAQSANNPWFQISPLANIGNSYDDQGREARSKKDYPQAIKLLQQSLGVFKQGLEVARQMPDRGWEASMLFNIGQCYKVKGLIAKDVGQPPAKQLMLLQQSLPFLQQALTIAKDQKNAGLTKSILTHLYISLGSIGQAHDAEGDNILKDKKDYLQAINQFEQGLEAYKQGLTVVRQITDRQLEASILLSIGSSYRKQEDALSDLEGDKKRRLTLSQQSLPYLQQALLIAKDLKQAKLIETILNGIALVHYSMADVYSDLKQYDKALEEVRLESAAAKESGILKSQHLAQGTEYNIYVSMRNFYDVPEQYDKYLEVTQKLIELTKQQNMPESRILKFEANIAQVYKFRGQYAQALAAYQKILIRAQAIHDPKVEYLALVSIGSIYDDQAKYSRALEIYEQALRVVRTMPDNRTAENSILNNIGIVYRNQANYSQALAFIQKSLENDQKYYAQYSKGMIPENIQEHCEILKRSGDLDKGSSLAARYAEVCDHPDHPLPGFTFNAFKRVINAWTNTERGMIGIGFNNAGVIYASQGDYLKSAEFKQKSLNIARERKDQNSEATYLLNIGSDFIALGDYDKAVQVVQQALKINLAQNNLPNEVFTRSNLGTIARNQGDYTAALKEYQQALTISQKIGMRSSEATLFSGIGIVYQSQGNYASAMDNYQQALKIQQDLGEPATVIVTLLQIGNLQRQLGQPKLALATHQQALATAQNIGARQREAQAQLAIAADYRELGQFSEALKLSEETLQLATSIDDLNGINQALYSIGQLYTQQNQPEKAIDALQKALKLQQRMGIKPSQAQTLSAIGQVQTQLGKYAEAQTTLQDSFVIAQGVGDRATQAQAISHLADLATKQNQTPLAIVLYKQSVIQYEIVRKGLAPLPKDQQESYAKTVSQTYRNLADLLIQNDRLLEAQQVLDLLKLQEIKDYSPATRNALQDNEVKLTDIEKEIAKKHGTLISFRQKLDQCQGKINNAECETLDRDRNQQGQALNEFLVSLKAQVIDRCQKNQEESCIAPSSKLTSAANKMIAAQPGSLIIMPVVLDNKIWILTIADGGIITRYESQVDRITLGKKVLELRQQLETPNSDIKQLQTTSKQLYDWLIKPIEPTLKTAKTPPKLIFALDRVTRYIPMGVLYDGQQYLTQRYPISTILSIETTNINKRTIGNVNTTNILALGLSRAVADFRALPSVNPELASIVQKSGIYPGQILLDRDFTRSNLSNNLKNRNILHIATHGKFDPTQPKGSFLVLGNGEKLPIADISTLDYSQLDLVVLSACQTALGNPDQDGTEIPGISSHFLNNGAASVMASLWSVDDASTALMMQSFYRNLSQNKPKNEALRQAQLDLLKLDTSETSRTAIEALPRFTEPISDIKTAPRQPPQNTPGYSHPYYWAPFILIGNSQ